jgi:hypothetical protein
MPKKKKSQVMGHFTMPVLYNYSIKSYSEDYKLKELTVTYLPSIFVVLKGLKLTARRHTLRIFSAGSGISEVREACLVGTELFTQRTRQKSE